jgi:hypothetical protein
VAGGAPGSVLVRLRSRVLRVSVFRLTRDIMLGTLGAEHGKRRYPQVNIADCAYRGQTLA